MFFLWLVAVVLVLVGSSFYPIPPNCFAERRFFGKRMPKVKTKWAFWLPRFLGGSMSESVSLEPREISDSVTFTTNDTFFKHSRSKPSVTISYYLKIKADPRVLDKNGRSAFLGTSPAAIQREINATLKGKLGALGGVIGSQDFLGNRNAIEDYIRCSLQMKIPSHRQHDKICNEKNCEYHGVSEVPNKSMLKFYNTHREPIGAAIRGEKEMVDDISQTEENNGVDVELFRLENVDFSEATKRALEEEEVQIARAAAAQSQVDLAEKFKALGADPKTAINASQAAIIHTPRESISVETDGPVTVIAGNIPGLGNSQKKSGDDRKPRGGRR